VNDFDIVFVGGGLASGLCALRLAELRPDVRVGIVEAGAAIGGDHIWSSFDADLSAAQRAWTAPLYAHRWDSYEVRFPSYGRSFNLGYASARSVLLDKAVRAALPSSAILTSISVAALDAAGVTLADQRRITAGLVIDARGQGSGTAALDLAFQKFVGLEIETERPHGLTRPIVMDATVDQFDGYRFVYVLPWDSNRLLVEDTYYADAAALDDAAVIARAESYAARWGVFRTLRVERGVLPIALGGDIARLLAGGPASVPRIGLGAGLFHPVTGYSFPDAVRTADLIAGLPHFDAGYVAGVLAGHAERQWRETAYYRLLNRFMFRAAEPADRYRVLQHFYGLPEPLVARFYAGRTSSIDKLRILVGKPPVPVSRALGVLFGLR
jgi:lycopene beta-cyclase